VNAERLRLRSGGLEVLLQSKSLARRSLSFWEISYIAGLINTHHQAKKDEQQRARKPALCSTGPPHTREVALQAGTPRVACLGFPGSPWLLVISSPLQEVI
jgi:hypothetical protein